MNQFGSSTTVAGMILLKINIPASYYNAEVNCPATDTGWYAFVVALSPMLSIDTPLWHPTHASTLLGCAASQLTTLKAECVCVYEMGESIVAKRETPSLPLVTLSQSETTERLSVLA